MNKQLSFMGLLLVLCGNLCFSQKASLLSHIDNNYLKFSTFTTSTKIIDSDKVIISSVRINVNLSARAKKKLLKLKRKDWVILLNDKGKDWAANLCLYDIYHKDGSVYKLLKTKDQWYICCKENDLTYWTKFLKK